MPVTQTWSARQALPQAPQWLASVSTCTQLRPQRVASVGQPVTQAPSLQTLSAVH